MPGQHPPKDGRGDRARRRASKDRRAGAARRPRLIARLQSLRPIHLLRYGLPAAVAIAGIVVVIVGNGNIATAAGFALIVDAFVVVIVNVLARLTISSQGDRDREQQARETFARTGRWPEPRRRRR